jgi:hypothetical protein
MREWLISIRLFIVRAWGIAALGVAFVINPVRFLQFIGWVPTTYAFPIKPQQFQMLLGVVVLAAMLIWFHRQRMAFVERQAPHPTVPLYEALRYISRDSVWASRQEPDRREDEKWAIRHREEVLRQLTLGRLRTWGRQIAGERRHGLSEIGTAFWGRADHFEPFSIMMDNSTEHTVHTVTGSAFSNIRFLRTELEYVWPRRPFWDALLRRSPVERTGLDKEWKRQDSINDARAIELGAERERRSI